MPATSEGQRWAIVHEWQQGQSIKAVATRVGVSVKACKTWISRFQSTGTVKDSPRSGRPSKLSEAAQDMALDMLLGNEVGGANTVAGELHTKEATATRVSKQTVIRGARRAGDRRGLKRLRALRGKPTKQLTPDTLRKRITFCNKHQNDSWGNVMFTDRKKFAFSYPGSKVHAVTWTHGDGKRQANAVNHASVVNAYAGLTRFGMTELHLVTGTTGEKTTYTNKQGKAARNITSKEYKAVLECTLLPEGRRIFSAQGIGSWVLQQDNDPTHKEAPKIVNEFNRKHGSSITVLPNWPPNSPDLSLIENVWAYLQAKLNALGCKTFQEFKGALKKEVKALNKEFAERLFKGMGARLKACLKREGDRTKH